MVRDITDRNRNNTYRNRSNRQEQEPTAEGLRVGGGVSYLSRASNCLSLFRQRWSCEKKNFYTSTFFTRLRARFCGQASLQTA